MTPATRAFDAVFMTSWITPAARTLHYLGGKDVHGPRGVGSRHGRWFRDARPVMADRTADEPGAAGGAGGRVGAAPVVRRERQEQPEPGGGVGARRRPRRAAARAQRAAGGGGVRERVSRVGARCRGARARASRDRSRARAAGAIRRGRGRRRMGRAAHEPGRAPAAAALSADDTRWVARREEPRARNGACRGDAAVYRELGSGRGLARGAHAPRDREPTRRRSAATPTRAR